MVTSRTHLCENLISIPQWILRMTFYETSRSVNSMSRDGSGCYWVESRQRKRCQGTDDNGYWCRSHFRFGLLPYPLGDGIWQYPSVTGAATFTAVCHVRATAGNQLFGGVISERYWQLEVETVKLLVFSSYSSTCCPLSRWRKSIRRFMPAYVYLYNAKVVHGIIYGGLLTSQVISRPEKHLIGNRLCQNANSLRVQCWTSAVTVLMLSWVS